MKKEWNGEICRHLTAGEGKAQMNSALSHVELGGLESREGTPILASYNSSLGISWLTESGGRAAHRKSLQPCE